MHQQLLLIYLCFVTGIMYELGIFAYVLNMIKYVLLFGVSYPGFFMAIGASLMWFLINIIR